MKQSEAEKNAVSQEIQDRLLRKLHKFREKYEFNKKNLATPWCKLSFFIFDLYYTHKLGMLFLIQSVSFQSYTGKIGVIGDTPSVLHKNSIRFIFYLRF